MKSTLLTGTMDAFEAFDPDKMLLVAPGHGMKSGFSLARNSYLQHHLTSGS